MANAYAPASSSRNPDPLSIVQQICVLLALTNDLMERIPLEKMTDAQKALIQAAESIPKDVAGRFATAEKLSDPDKKAVLDIASKSAGAVPAKAVDMSHTT